MSDFKEQATAMDAEARAVAALVSALRVNLTSITVMAPISGAVVNKPPRRRVVYMLDDGEFHVSPITLEPTFGSGFELVKGSPAGSKLVKEQAKRA